MFVTFTGETGHTVFIAKDKIESMTENHLWIKSDTAPRFLLNESQYEEMASQFDSVFSIDSLKQVVALQGEMIKELLADVKALKGEPSEPLETHRMYAEDMDWKEGEEQENELLRRAIAFELPRSTDLKDLKNNLCNNQWLRQKAISLGIDVSHIKETV